MSRRRASAGDEPGEGEGDERPPLALLEGWCDEATLTAQLVATLTDVGTVVNMLSLYERMEALRQAAGLEPSPLPSNNKRAADIVAFRALLEAHPSLFVVTTAPWSPRARLVDLAPGAAARRAKPPPRNMRAEDAYEAQLVAYLGSWKTASVGSLGLDNPPPAGVAERVSTMAFVSCRSPALFILEPAAAGQQSVRLAGPTSSRAASAAGAERRIATKRGSHGRGKAVARAEPEAPAPAERRRGHSAASPAPEQAAATSQPAFVWGTSAEQPPPRNPWRPYAPPPDRTEVAVPVPLPLPAPLEMPTLLAALPPQHSILPPPAAKAATPARAAAPETAEARLLRVLWSVPGGDRLLAHMAEQGIQASDLLHLRTLPPAEADAELQLLGFAEAVQRSRVRAALRETAADQ